MRITSRQAPEIYSGALDNFGFLDQEEQAQQSQQDRQLTRQVGFSADHRDRRMAYISSAKFKIA